MAKLINPVIWIANSIRVTLDRRGKNGQVFLRGDNGQFLVVQRLVYLDELSVRQAQNPTGFVTVKELLAILALQT